MRKISWRVAGMDCTNCALSIKKYLSEEHHLSNVQVRFISGEVKFEIEKTASLDAIKQGLADLGYRVEAENINHGTTAEKKATSWCSLNTNGKRFFFSLLFTLPLWLHMFVPWHALMNPWLQLCLSTPVFLLGMFAFGRNALHSIRSGIPNMNVLISLGALASYGYSLYGTLDGKGADYLFYETTATIITLVFLGNWLEHNAIAATQKSLKALTIKQKVIANMIVFDDKHQEQIFQVDNADLRVGDLILIKNGDLVPMDAKILWGHIGVDEAILTGESIPVEKSMNDTIIGGSVVVSGTAKAYVTAVGEDTVLSQILSMVKDAENEKPPMQQLADRISAVFVPLIVGLAVLTYLLNLWWGQATVETSLLRSIAVLVIACPCAMGLATPAAIAVGLGRAARNGILFKKASSLELFKDIKQVVFDKTGTLTTGVFRIKDFGNLSAIDDNTLKNIIVSLEKYSNHPIAKAIVKAWGVKGGVKWKKVEEISGLGIKGIDDEGNEYIVGSYKIANQLTTENNHSVYFVKNNTLWAWVDVEDTIRAEAKEVIAKLQAQGIKTVLLSGDKKEKCIAVAEMLNIQEVIAEQTPQQKLEQITILSKQMPTAMVGDGINDAPALAKATIGISLSNATQIAMQSAQVVLMNGGIKKLPMALSLGKYTFATIKSNLWWAFSYNIFAIPIAAFGYLRPEFAALVMGFSDVVLAVNSIALNYKKV